MSEFVWSVWCVGWRWGLWESNQGYSRSFISCSLLLAIFHKSLFDPHSWNDTCTQTHTFKAIELAKLIFILLPETVTSWEEVPASLLVHFPYIGLLEREKSNEYTALQYNSAKYWENINVHIYLYIYKYIYIYIHIYIHIHFCSKFGISTILKKLIAREHLTDLKGKYLYC